MWVVHRRSPLPLHDHAYQARALMAATRSTHHSLMDGPSNCEPDKPFLLYAISVMAIRQETTRAFGGVFLWSLFSWLSLGQSIMATVDFHSVGFSNSTFLNRDASRQHSPGQILTTSQWWKSPPLPLPLHLRYLQSNLWRSHTWKKKDLFLGFFWCFYFFFFDFIRQDKKEKHTLGQGKAWKLCLVYIPTVFLWVTGNKIENMILSPSITQERPSGDRPKQSLFRQQPVNHSHGASLLHRFLIWAYKQTSSYKWGEK